MSVTGIIAEYNPFHNGHLYHLNQAREASGASALVCVLSGNFTQRGEPAVFNKWARAEMALRAGIDLVLELPVLYATRSAYWFARGGVETLFATGLVSHLAFGVECDNPGALLDVAKFLAEENLDFKNTLREYLKKGLSYPKARALSLEALRGKSGPLLDKPNNILGITYLQVIQERNLPLQPVFIQRQGAGYLEQELDPGQYPSARALRHKLANCPLKMQELANSFSRYLPPTSLEIIQREMSSGKGPVFFRQLELLLLALLRRSSQSGLAGIVDVNEGLENRILEAARKAATIEEFLLALKTKRYTYTKLQRFLIHLLLNYTKDLENCLEAGPPYLRILGFSPKGRVLLSKMKDTASCPIIVKTAHLKGHLENQRIKAFWEAETRSTDIYSLLYSSPEARMGAADFRTGPVIVQD